jgi:hypothetical protein
LENNRRYAGRCQVSDALISRDDSQLTVSFLPSAYERKESSLAASALIGRVSNSAEQETAVSAQIEIKRLLDLVEMARVECKRPILDFGRKIDDAAKTFVHELKKEQLRIGTLIGDFQTLEQARVRAAEAARLKELNEIERQRQEQIATARSHDEIDTINERANQEAASVPVVQPRKAEGQVVRDDWEIIVTDLMLLTNAHRNCVKIEPLVSEIKTLLRAGVKVAGVSAKPIVKSGVRVGREPLAITV